MLRQFPMSELTNRSDNTAIGVFMLADANVSDVLVLE
jgi:hypothetical protein